MDIRCGFFPGQSPKEIQQAIERHLEITIKNDSSLENINYTIAYSGFQSPGCVVDTSSKFISLLSDTHEKELGRPAELFASAATTDVRTFQLYGHIPATCYGPEALNIHGIDESVSIQSTVDVSRVICHFITQWCGIEKVD
jgi:acetylornithine deacetylase